MGQWLYPDSKEILILADGGGSSNGWRNRLWKKKLQQWADQEGLTLMICHFPPGTSKWNKIEHRMFSHITRNWRGKPLISHEVIINLICATRTSQGLKIEEKYRPPCSKGLGSRNGGSRHRKSRIPRRVELLHSTKSLDVYFAVNP